MVTEGQKGVSPSVDQVAPPRPKRIPLTCFVCQKPGHKAFQCPLRMGEDKSQERSMNPVRHRGSGRGSFICGQSVHNQRIERLWRDVFSACIVLYYRLFYYMEDINIMDPECDVHLFCLHYVYMPRINRSLILFKDASFII